MDFNAYQQRALETAVYPGQSTVLGLMYAALGLNGEAGEVAEQVKKILRDDQISIIDKFLDILDGVEADLASVMQTHTTTVERARESVKTVLQDEYLTDERRDKIVKELGDSLWYAAQVATEIGISLDDVAKLNLAKLAARKEAGMIQGYGSEREVAS